MAPWIKALAVKPHNLSLIPGINEVEGGLQFHYRPHYELVSLTLTTKQ